MLSVTLAAGLLGQAAPAAASDGRARDAVAEVAAYYRHFLGRAPDTAGLMHFLDAVNVDCRAGVRSAGWAIANSGEAAAFLRHNDRRANSLYAGFLDRVPDPQGWHDQKNALDAGVSFAQITRNVQASPEFGARLDAMCAGARSRETVDCTSIAAQGPPSASIPPGQQTHFNCYPAAGGSAPTLSQKCMVALVEATTGIDKGNATIRDTGRFVLKKAGPVGWAKTGIDVVVAFRSC